MSAIRHQAGVAELPIWSEAGKEKYFADPVTLTLVMFILFNFVEVRRYRDMMNPGSMNEVRTPWQLAAASWQHGLSRKFTIFM